VGTALREIPNSEFSKGYTPAMTTAAAIIIGDEILSGKVRDANTVPLIDLFTEIGVDLQRISYIGDAEEDIISEVRACAERYDAVITSGGVGPTHDDRTVAAISKAFGVEVERHPDLVEMIKMWWGDRFTEAALRMADIPAGSRLIHSSDGLIPMVAFRNVYIFPGIPRLFAAKIPALRGELTGRPKHLANLYLNSDESSIADRLTAVDGSCPEVKIGSYPRSEGEDHRVWITFEAADPAAVNAALDQLLEVLDQAEVVRIERSNV
jgi:molybdenum cofactor synthesis domain-containing protein